MKTLLPIFCLAVLASACSSPADPTQAAVGAYLRKTLDDPASYAPVRFGAATPWRQRDADTTAATGRVPAWATAARAYQAQADSVNQLARLGADEDVFNAYVRKSKAAASKTDSLSAIILTLKVSKNPAVLGQLIRHTFRAKNKLGAVVLDSARFVVLNTGAVTVL